MRSAADRAAVSAASLLGLLCLAQMQFLGVVFDAAFAYVAPGLATLAVAGALARGPRGGAPSPTRSLALASLAASAGTAVALCLPQGPAISFLLLLAVLAAPFYFAARTIARVCESAPALRTMTLLAAAAGALGAPWCLDHLRGPLVLTSAVGLVLALLSVAGNAAGSAGDAGGAGSRGGLLRLPGLALLAALGMLGAQIFALGPARVGVPPHVAGDPARLKPVLGELHSGAQAELLETRWDSFGRTDLVRFANRQEEFVWIFTNGTSPVPLLASATAGHTREGLLRRFPLLGIPILLTSARRALVVGTAAGVEAELAARLGTERAEVHARNRAAEAMRRARQQRQGVRVVGGARAGTPPGAEEPTPAFGDPLAGLREAAEKYGLVLLTFSQAGERGRLFSHEIESRLATRESLALLWEHVETGGVMAIVVRDPLLFARLALTAWELLIGGEARPSLAERAWALRLEQDAPFKTPYRHLLLLPKGGAPRWMAERLRREAAELPAEILFGPGFRTQPAFAPFAHPRGVGEARRLLRNELSRRAGGWVDLRSATARRPFPFLLVEEVHPHLRWLVAACLALATGLLLIPGGVLRHVDAPGSAARPPLPIYLGGILAAGLATGLGWVAAARGAVLAGGGPARDASILAAGFLAGFAATGLLARPGRRLRGGDPPGGADLAAAPGSAVHWRTPARILGPLLPAALALAMREGLLAPFGAGSVSGGGHAAALLGVALALGLVARAPLLPGLECFAGELGRLRPTALRLYGVGMLAAGALAQWAARAGGWPSVWTGAAAAWVLLSLLQCVVALWTRRSRNSQSARM